MTTNTTVGLFTYHRPGYLRRQLVFFKEFGGLHRLIVLDGSESDEIADLNRTSCKEFNAEYVREIDAQDRYLILDQKLDTDFVAYASDDDLIFPAFYSEGALFLKNNRDYSVVAGLLPTMHYVKKHLWLGYYFRDYLSGFYDLQHGDFVERLAKRDQSCQMGVPPTYYGVRRTAVHKMYCKYMKRLKQYSSMERLETICNLIHGGIKVLHVPMGFRDYSSTPIIQPQRDDPKQYICDEDILVLQDVIRTEMRAKVGNDVLLEYFSGYAWLLPLRNPQNNGLRQEWKYRLAVECLVNKYFGHFINPFDSKVTRVLRKAQREISRGK